ncbi:MAG: hypothetical protein ACE5HA_14485, partial [Anaerolineae bacterium]
IIIADVRRFAKLLVFQQSLRYQASGSWHGFCAVRPRLGLDMRLKALLDQRRSVARDSKFCAIAIPPLPATTPSIGAVDRDVKASMQAGEAESSLIPAQFG